jgi:mannose-1-phosphate guanylyltransferase
MSLLQEALRRAQAFAACDRICTIVAEDHGQWWETGLGRLPARNVIVQPQNRGTGIGILMPLLHIMERDPRARLVLLPSDHHVRDEDTLARSIRLAIGQLRWHPAAPVILGVEPDNVDPELGYIVPGADAGCGMRAVGRFVEKPPVETARELIRAGALWNVFIVVARAEALLGLFVRKYPAIVAALREAVLRDLAEPAGASATRELYRRLPTVDFSRDLVQGSEAALRVLRVPRCGWSDLGTPARVAQALRRSPEPASAAEEPLFAPGGGLDLSAQHARLGT